MKHLKSTFKNQKGMALIIAIFTVVLICYLVVEITYETSVEYTINANSVNRIKAYYAARSGLELSLIRVKLYNKIQRQLGSKMGAQAKMLDLIWSFPFAWPLMAPDGATEVDKGMIKDTMGESKMDGSYSINITDEGSKFDINDLGSEAKALRDITKKQLLNMWESKMKDDDFAKNHRDIRFDEIVNNIEDWVDANVDKVDGRGNESDLYADKNTQEVQLPPNRNFRTVEELRLVAGVTEEIYDILKDRVTVYGMKAINPNHASREVLMSLDPAITDEIAGEIIKRRDDNNLGGPFQDGSDSCKSDFWNFVTSKGGRVDKTVEDSTPLRCNKVINFRITSTGEFGGVSRQITAVVYDVKAGAETVATQVKKQNTTTPTPTPGPGTQTQTRPPDPLPKGPPRIVYYSER